MAINYILRGKECQPIFSHVRWLSLKTLDMIDLIKASPDVDGDGIE